jgi:hypothetical protein
MRDEVYVTNDAWLRDAGRPDLIDEVADQYERPTGALSTDTVAHGMQGG